MIGSYNCPSDSVDSSGSATNFGYATITQPAWERPAALEAGSTYSNHGTDQRSGTAIYIRPDQLRPAPDNLATNGVASFNLELSCRVAKVLRSASITDGTSNTCGFLRNKAIDGNEARARCCHDIGDPTINPGTIVGGNIDNLIPPGQPQAAGQPAPSIVVPACTYLGAGYYTRIAYREPGVLSELPGPTGYFNHDSIPPNSPLWDCGTGSGFGCDQQPTHASTWPPGAITRAASTPGFADGSVKFIKNTINPVTVWNCGGHQGPAARSSAPMPY